MSLTITLIAAMASNRVIGKDNTIPWHIPEDFKFFKAQTIDKPIIMGRATFESLGNKPLPKRTNIVVSNTLPDHHVNSSFLVARSLDEAITLAKAYVQNESPEIMLIGGYRIYEQGLEIADRILLTEIDEEFEGDTTFPEVDESKWEEVARTPFLTSSTHSYAHVTYERLSDTTMDSIN